jgi:hypothetical protein
LPLLARRRDRGRLEDELGVVAGVEPEQPALARAVAVRAHLPVSVGADERSAWLRSRPRAA